MKYIFRGIFTAALLAAAATGCSPAERFLRADTAAIEIAADDTSDHAITVEASSSWIVDVSGTVDWLVTGYSGDNPSVLWATASTNENDEERSAFITLVSGDGLTFSIPVRQLGMEVSFDVSPLSLPTFGPREETPRTLTVATNLVSGWECFTLHSSEWIRMTPGDAEDGAENEISVGVTPSRLFDQERRDTIVVRPAKETFHDYADSIVVVQRGIALLVDSEEFMNPTTFTVEVPAEGAEVSLSVYSLAEWSIATVAAPEWVAIDLVEGPASAEGVPVTVTVAPNISTEDYTFALDFESADETYTYNFIQKGTEPEPEPTTGE